MVNNFDQIHDLLFFENRNEFYFLQILQRKKENTEIGSNAIVIKTYFIRSKDSLMWYKDQIIKMCEIFNARAYITLNKRNAEYIALKTLSKICDQMANKDFEHVYRAYESVCGLYSAETDKKWIVDIDETDLTFVEQVKEYIIELFKDITDGENKIYAIISTKNGYHLITSPFNTQKFGQKYPKIDVQKNNPTLLYIP